MTPIGTDALPPGRIRAVTFDYWDTLYDGAATPQRVSRRRLAVGQLLAAYGAALPPEDVARIYTEAGREADRWWREEHRGYTTADRLHEVLRRAGLTARASCRDVAACAEAVDDALLTFPPPLLEGARALVEELAAEVPLATISDTGFASGAAQDRLLAHDGLRDHFAARVYSVDVGWAKPRPEPFAAALATFAERGIAPHEVVHVGDIERTDVRGALAAGMRAVRLDVVRRSGPSEAELVAESFAELRAFLRDNLARPAAASGRTAP